MLKCSRGYKIWGAASFLVHSSYHEYLRSVLVHLPERYYRTSYASERRTCHLQFLLRILSYMNRERQPTVSLTPQSSNKSLTTRIRGSRWEPSEFLVFAPPALSPKFEYIPYSTDRFKICSRLTTKTRAAVLDPWSTPSLTTSPQRLFDVRILRQLPTPITYQRSKKGPCGPHEKPKYLRMASGALHTEYFWHRVG